jgi:hypothetical protein
MKWIVWLFGQGSELEIWQMMARAVAIFFIALLLIRASGRRFFGQHAPFDACVTVLLGAVLSRAVAGASPFWATVAAGGALELQEALMVQDQAALDLKLVSLGRRTRHHTVPPSAHLIARRTLSARPSATSLSAVL